MREYVWLVLYNKQYEVRRFTLKEQAQSFVDTQLALWPNGDWTIRVARCKRWKCSNVKSPKDLAKLLRAGLVPPPNVITACIKKWSRT